MERVDVLSLVNNIQEPQCTIDILLRRRLKKTDINDINEPYFASEFTQTKLMVHGHRHDDENCIGRSSGNMTMDLVIASGGTAMVRKSLSECLGYF